MTAAAKILARVRPLRAKLIERRLPCPLLVRSTTEIAVRRGEKVGKQGTRGNA
jgi:hypothetical protein